LLAGNATVKG
jgi:hypothetical protein